MDAPVPCYGAFSTECGGCHYTWRGWGPGEKATTIRVFNPTVDKWTNHPTSGAIPRALTDGGFVSIERSIYCFGGQNDKFEWFNELHKLNLETFQWVKVHPKNDPAEYPICKIACGFVSLNNKTLCCFGGYGIPNLTQSSPGSTFTRNTRSTNGFGWTNEFHLFDLERGTIINHYSTFVCTCTYSVSVYPVTRLCIHAFTHITYSCIQSCDYTMFSHSQTHFQESGRHLY